MWVRTAFLFSHIRTGNVGIGTIEPKGKLTVAAGGVNGILLSPDLTNHERSSRLIFSDNLSSNAIFRYDNKLCFSSGATINSSSGSSKVVITDDGDVGIGTVGPKEKLEVKGNLLVSNMTSETEAIIKACYKYNETARIRSARVELGSSHSKNDPYYSKVWSIESFSKNSWANSPEFRINQGTQRRFCINYQGNVGIGKAANSSAKLDVAGTIRATEIKVVAQTADFVFEKNYPLRDLNQVEKFIKQNKHLPDIPSSAEMEASGVNLAEMNKLLLQKIEELTLYLIEKEEEVTELKSQMENQKNKLSFQDSAIEGLKDEIEAIKALLLDEQRGGKLNQ